MTTEDEARREAERYAEYQEHLQRTAVSDLLDAVKILGLPASLHLIAAQEDSKPNEEEEPF